MSDEGLFYTLHGMAVDALEGMEAERDAVRARAEAAEAEAARLTAALEQAQDGAELERGRVAALEMCVATGNDAIGEAHAEIARLRAELAQAGAEGEAAGAARERADVVELLRGGAHSHRGFGVRLIADELEQYAETIERGRHVGAAGGGAR